MAPNVCAQQGCHPMEGRPSGPLGRLTATGRRCVRAVIVAGDDNDIRRQRRCCNNLDVMRATTKAVVVGVELRLLLRPKNAILFLVVLSLWIGTFDDVAVVHGLVVVKLPPSSTRSSSSRSKDMIDPCLDHFTPTSSSPSSFSSSSQPTSFLLGALSTSFVAPLLCVPLLLGWDAPAAAVATPAAPPQASSSSSSPFPTTTTLVVAVKNRNEALCGTGFYTNIWQYKCTELGDIQDEGTPGGLSPSEESTAESLLSKFMPVTVAGEGGNGNGGSTGGAVAEGATPGKTGVDTKSAALSGDDNRQ